MTYTLPLNNLDGSPNLGVLRDDGAYIPADPENRDYREYLAWVAEGGIPNPATVPPPDPGPSVRDEALALVESSGVLTAEQMASLGGE